MGSMAYPSGRRFQSVKERFGKKPFQASAIRENAK
jgi:hypothetical protein